MADPIAGPTVSTCGLFTDAEQVVACCPAAGDLAYSDPDTFDLVLQAASDYVSELLARQFRGVCETTLHACPPCSCGCGPTWGGWGWTWGSDCDCRCGPYPTIDLGADPVVEVTSVTFEGDVVDPATYRVDDWRYLVREDDATGDNPGWPRPVRNAAEPGGTGELLVVYRHGTEVPPLAQLAARDVACLMVEGCPGDACSIPGNATQISSQGVTIDLAELAEAVAADTPSVRRAVAAYNPGGWRSGAVVDDPSPSGNVWQTSV